MSDIIGNITSANIDGTVQTNSSISGSLYPKGEKGDPGNGISSIVKTGSVGKVDTYTITFDDETTTTFTVTNGNDGANGADGKGLEFNWQGTQLGVRVEGTQEYTYVDLKGPQGEPGTPGPTYTAGTGIDITNNVISNTQTSAEWGNITGTLSNQTDLNTALGGKQDSLVSGTNIKTINNTSILGSGNISVDNEVFIGNEQDAPQEAKIVIDPDEDIPIVSEVVNSLAGNEINKAPSVHSLKEAITIVSNTEPVGNLRRKVWLQHSKNLFDGELEVGTITTDGTNYPNNSRKRSKNYIEVEPNTTYTLSFNSAATTIVFEYDENKNFIQQITESWQTQPYTFTTLQNTKYVRFISYTTDTTQAKLEEGSSVLEDKTYILNDNDVYEEFKPKEIPTSWINLGNGIHYKQKGDLVKLKADYWSQNGVNVPEYGTTKMATLPEGSRPSGKIQFPIYCKTPQNTALIDIWGRIDTDGSIYLQNGNTPARTVQVFYMDTMFFTD